MCTSVESDKGADKTACGTLTFKRYSGRTVCYVDVPDYGASVGRLAIPTVISHRSRYQVQCIDKNIIIPGDVNLIGLCLGEVVAEEFFGEKSAVRYNPVRYSVMIVLIISGITGRERLRGEDSVLGIKETAVTIVYP